MIEKEIFTLTASEIKHNGSVVSASYDPDEFYDILENHPDAYIQAFAEDGEETIPLTAVSKFQEVLRIHKAQMEHRSL